jgi:hypothetical protein
MLAEHGLDSGDFHKIDAVGDDRHGAEY